MASSKRVSKYLEFAKRLREAMARNGVTSKAVEAELRVSDETVRLWRAGERMPGHDNMKWLARMLGVSSAFLRDGEISEADALPGALVITDDEERLLIETYRSLKPWGQQALRKRAAQLLEDFGPKSPANPYGKKSADSH
jgi:transcriptional regulator with XRE-family HTH domain